MIIASRDVFISFFRYLATRCENNFRTRFIMFFHNILVHYTRQKRQRSANRPGSHNSESQQGYGHIGLGPTAQYRRIMQGKRKQGDPHSVTQEQNPHSAIQRRIAITCHNLVPIKKSCAFHNYVCSIDQWICTRWAAFTGWCYQYGLALFQ